MLGLSVDIFVEEFRSLFHRHLLISFLLVVLFLSFEESFVQILVHLSSFRVLIDVMEV